MDPMADQKNLEEDHFAPDNAYGEGAEAHLGYDQDNFHHAGKVEENPYESSQGYGNGGSYQQNYDQGYGRGGYNRQPRGRGSYGGGDRGGRGGYRGNSNRFDDRNSFNPRQNFGGDRRYGGGSNDIGQGSYDEMIGRVAQPGYKTEYMLGNPYAGNDAEPEDENHGAFSPKVK